MESGEVSPVPYELSTHEFASKNAIESKLKGYRPKKEDQ